ncbi:MAG: hypothetical protein LBH30_06665, partial [Prevotellaceae bacterium]|nr:hypothetical protein [Prevotellaceae bacterium]
MTKETCKKLNEIKLPEILYKFRRWDCETHQRLLHKGEIYFSTPAEFNDCFIYLLSNFTIMTEHEYSFFNTMHTQGDTYSDEMGYILYGEDEDCEDEDYCYDDEDYFYDDENEIELWGEQNGLCDCADNCYG